MRKLPDLPNSVQLASESPDNKDVLAFESLKVGTTLPNLPNAVQLASETPDSANTMGWFAAAKIIS